MRAAPRPTSSARKWRPGRARAWSAVAGGWPRPRGAGPAPERRSRLLRRRAHAPGSVFPPWARLRRCRVAATRAVLRESCAVRDRVWGDDLFPASKIGPLWALRRVGTGLRRCPYPWHHQIGPPRVLRRVGAGLRRRCITWRSKSALQECYAVFVLVWIAALSLASWNWLSKSAMLCLHMPEVLPCHVAFKKGPSGALCHVCAGLRCCHVTRPLKWALQECYAMSAQVWSTALSPGLLKLSLQEPYTVFVWAWGAAVCLGSWRRPFKSTLLCLCRPWGAAVSPQPPENSPSSWYRWAHACSPAVGSLVVAAVPVSLTKVLLQCARRLLRKLEWMPYTWPTGFLPSSRERMLYRLSRLGCPWPALLYLKGRVWGIRYRICFTRHMSVFLLASS